MTEISVNCLISLHLDSVFQMIADNPLIIPASNEENWQPITDLNFKQAILELDWLGEPIVVGNIFNDSTEVSGAYSW